jgi:protein associated with RNAse G/E
MIEEFKKEADQFQSRCFEVVNHFKDRIEELKKEDPRAVPQEDILKEMAEFHQIMANIIFKSMGHYTFLTLMPDKTTKILSIFSEFTEMLAEVMKFFSLDLFSVVHKDNAKDIMDITEYMVRTKRAGKIPYETAKMNIQDKAARILKNVRPERKINIVT